MEHTSEKKAQARNGVERGQTLMNIYIGNHQEGQDPYERLELRKASIEAYLSILGPIVDASKPTIMQQVDRFKDTSKLLMTALDEVARIHPFISIVIVGFKAVVKLEIERKENGQKIILLLVAMQDMMGTILELNNLNNLGGSETSNLMELMKKILIDIENCGCTCDSYGKKNIISKIAKSAVWESKLQGYIDLFKSDKHDIRDVLAKYTAHGVSMLNEKLDGLHADVKKLFESLRSPKEKHLMESMNCDKKDLFEDDLELRKLINISEGKSFSTSDPISPSEAKIITQIREEMKEELSKMLDDNRKMFEGKLRIQTANIIDETQRTVRRESDRIISALGNRPYDRILDSALHEVWREMQFRGSVKARHLILALREYYMEKLQSTTAKSSTRQSSPILSSPVSLSHSSQDETPIPAISESDEWTLQYIHIVRIQPLIEALDDDASGFITVREANQFTKMRLPNWSVPQWFAYWAAGFQLSVYSYCEQIKVLIGHMQYIAESSLSENRVPISSYLASDALRKLERILCGVSKGSRELRWSDFSDSNLTDIIRARNAFEENRIEGKLKEIHWYIDEPRTVTLISGPGRIEMYLFTLLYLLVRRHCLVVELSQTVIINVDEIKEAEESIDSVCIIVQNRLDGLKSAFRQQNFDVAGELQRFCCGMFSCFEESDKNITSMRYDYYPSLASDKAWFIRKPQVITEGLVANDILRYRTVDAKVTRTLTPFNHRCSNLNCGRRLESTMYVCFVCTEPAKLLSRQTAHFCSNCAYNNFSFKRGPTSWHHLRDHDMLQTRIELHPRKYILATEKLNAAKDVLQQPSKQHCSLCNPIVPSSVWACVTCEYQTFICVECNIKEQDSNSWTNHKENKARSGHNWSHPLVLCHPTGTKIAQGRSSDRLEDDTHRNSTLEKQMAQMTERIERLERLFKQILDSPHTVSRSENICKTQ